MSDGGSIKIYQFYPENRSDEPLPAVVYYHGGAFVLSYASTHVASVQEYANEANCMVFLVDYRLAPKHLFPTGFNDCYESLQWIHDNAEKLGVDPARLAVMGDSAGGAFSAGVAQKTLDEGGPELKGQVLVYPVCDRSCSTKSAIEFHDAPMFNGVANKKMWDMYLQNVPHHPVPPYAAPADREDLSGLPPAYIDNAEFDPLRDEAVDYAHRLEKAGVSVELHQPKGTVHGYDTVTDSRITKDILAKRIDFLKRIFS
jgi:acetyl esterase/lipase